MISLFFHGQELIGLWILYCNILQEISLTLWNLGKFKSSFVQNTENLGCTPDIQAFQGQKIWLLHQSLASRVADPGSTASPASIPSHVSNRWMVWNKQEALHLSIWTLPVMTFRQTAKFFEPERSLSPLPWHITQYRRSQCEIFVTSFQLLGHKHASLPETQLVVHSFISNVYLTHSSSFALISTQFKHPYHLHTIFAHILICNLHCVVCTAIIHNYNLHPPTQTHSIIVSSSVLEVLLIWTTITNRFTSQHIISVLLLRQLKTFNHDPWSSSKLDASPCKPIHLM